MTLAIYGPGGFGRELAAFARLQREVVFISDSPDEVGRRVNDIPVYDFEALANNSDWEVVIAVADASIRRRLADKCDAARVRAGNLVASDHQRGDKVIVQEGAVFCGGTICTSNLRIGRHFHCNIFSYVAHDCEVGDFVTLAPRVCINGNVIIEDDAYIGTGAVLKQGTRDKPLRIGRGSTVGMGAVVTRDVAPNTVVVGNPARVLER